MTRYFDVSRSASYSLLFAVPLLVMYELGAAWLARGGGSGLRNGADVMLRTLLAAGGIHGTVAFTSLLLAVAVFVVVLERRRRRVTFRTRVFAGMMAESIAYALLLGIVVGTATQVLLGGFDALLATADGPVAQLPLGEAIVLSMGAGIYEELVFRVLLVGGSRVPSSPAVWIGAGRGCSRRSSLLCSSPRSTTSGPTATRGSSRHSFSDSWPVSHSARYI